MPLIRSYKNVIVLLILSSSILLFLLPASTLEIVYGQVIFRMMRIILLPFSWIPFPVIYVLIIILVYLIVKLIYSKVSIMRKLRSLILGMTTIVLLFFLMWAFNYRRIDFSRRYPITNSSMDSLELFTELSTARNALIKNRPSVIQSYNTSEIERMIRPLVRRYCTFFGYSTPGRVRVKTVPSGTLLRIKTAGFYLPYAGEAYIDGGLHDIQIPFTMAHEMSHGYGVTDEGACNFIAYLATIHSVDSTIKYSGAMGYYRYVASEYRYHHPKKYQSIRDSLPISIQSDLDAINKQMLKYPDIFPRIRDKVYNKYLTSLNVRGGMASYDGIIYYVRQARTSGLINE